MSLFGNLVSEESLPAHKNEIGILAPMSGQVVHLNDVPCPAFAARLLGEGIAIQPTGFQCHAPFNAVVEEFPQTHHQIRLRAKNGLRLLIQFGYGSEKLMGEGFKSRIKPGQSVRKGAPLLEFDSRIMRNKLSSTLCPVTIVNSNKLVGILPRYNQVTAMQDQIMTLLL